MEEWKKYEESQQTKQFYLAPDPCKAKELIALSRIQLGRVARLTTRNNNLNYHWSLCNPGHTDKCRFCNIEKETYFHLFANCPAFIISRANIGGLHCRDHIEGWDIQGLLKFSLIPTISDTIEFYSSPNNILWSEDPDNTDDGLDFTHVSPRPRYLTLHKNSTGTVGQSTDRCLGFPIGHIKPKRLP